MEDVLADHEEGLARWRKERCQTLRKEAERSVADLGCDLADLRALSESLSAAARMKDEVRKVQAAGEQASAVARDGAAATARRSAVAAAARDRFREVERQRLQELRVEEAQLGAQEAGEAERLAEVKRCLALYRGHLGLDFARVAPHTVRFTFTLVDERRPEDEFGFTLGLAPGASGYSVTDCRPELPEGWLEALTRRLDAAEASDASALPALVCGMRRAFQDLAGCPKEVE